MPRRLYKRLVGKQLLEEYELWSYHRALEKAFDDDMESILIKVRDAIHKVTKSDKFMRAEIFLYESDLGLLIMNTFYHKGIDVLNVYDGFYFKSGVVNKTMFNEVYAKCIAILKHNMDCTEEEFITYAEI